MTWGFLWLMLALKIPIGGLLYIVWWAVHQTDEPETPPITTTAAASGRCTRTARCRAAAPGPRTTRRSPSPPPRVRSVVARARELPPR